MKRFVIFAFARQLFHARSSVFGVRSVPTDEQRPDGQLHELRREMDDRFQPTIVLQLPHGTDTPNTWRAAWLALNKNAKSIRAWAWRSQAVNATARVA
nr:hypothetical protein [Kofleriaceae bacterium]